MDYERISYGLLQNLDFFCILIGFPSILIGFPVYSDRICYVLLEDSLWTLQDLLCILIGFPQHSDTISFVF